MTSAGPRGTPEVVVTVLTRPGCHLCDEAVDVVAAVCAEAGVGWTEVDITDDPELVARWTDSVPVTLVRGEPHDFWRVSADRLRAAIEAAPGG